MLREGKVCVRGPAGGGGGVGGGGVSLWLYVGLILGSDEGGGGRECRIRWKRVQQKKKGFARQLRITVEGNV